MFPNKGGKHKKSETYFSSINKCDEKNLQYHDKYECHILQKLGNKEDLDGEGKEEKLNQVFVGYVTSLACGILNIVITTFWFKSLLKVSGWEVENAKLNFEQKFLWK